MTINRNDFVYRILLMSCGEVEDYASQHNMTLESLLDIVCDCLEDMEDQEILELGNKYGLDNNRLEDMIKSIVEKYQSQKLQH
jgi:hypothetical protein